MHCRDISIWKVTMIALKLGLLNGDWGPNPSKSRYLKRSFDKVD